MAARDSHVYMKNFPKIPVKLFEGTLTRYTTGFNEVGGAQDVAVYQYPIVKGDLVVLKDHSEQGVILVEKVAADGEFAHGIVIDTPEGIDNTTVSGQTPAAAYRRKASVAFFGIGVIELTVSATGAVGPGDIIGMDGDEQGEVEVQVDAASVAATDAGKLVALNYAAAGTKVALLVGASNYVGNT